MSALHFLNTLKSEDIQILSIERPTDDYTIDKDTENKTDTIRMILRANVEDDLRRLEFQFHMSEEILPLSFSSSDLNLMKRKVNPFQIRLFLEELFYSLNNIDSDELEKLMSENVKREDFMLYIHRYKILISFYHDTLSNNN